MDLVTFLKNSPSSRKLFGKRELVIIEKQSKGVSLTQSEKNRLSRDIRPKFEFINSVSRFSSDFKLKKGFEIWRLISETVDIILSEKKFSNSKLIKIILFGSAASNDLSLHSDIDIALDIRTQSLKESTILRKWLLGRVPESVDISFVQDLPSKLQSEILEKGIILWQEGEFTTRLKNYNNSLKNY